MNFFKRFRRSNCYGYKPEKDDSDAIFSLSSAYITLETKLNLKSTGKAAISLKSVSGTFFTEMKDDIHRFLDISKSDFDLSHNILGDSYGYLWVILNGKRMEDIIAGVTAVGEIINDKGFSKQLLAAIFEFKNNNRKNNQYLIYNYNLNKFYPFVPVAKKERDNENEMKIMATIADEIPFERDVTLWYPLWDMPL